MENEFNKRIEGLTVSTHQGASESILELLKNTILGTPGKLRYKQTEVEQNVSSLKNLEFIQIKKKDRVLGTTGIIKRQVSFKNQPIDALYVRYLSVYNPLKGSVKKYSDKTVKSSRPNRLRNQISSVFTSKLEQPFLDQDKSGIFYAYVESDNILSKNLCHSFGFKEIRSVFTLLFTRLFPKSQTNVFESGNDELATFKKGIKDYYKDHNFVFTDHIEDHGTCFFIKENDEIIAGIRAIPVKWNIVEISGFKGFLMQKVLPKLPGLSKVFNPEHLQFLAFDSIWKKKESKIEPTKLMEHACAEFGINLGMIWGDSESEITRNLQSSGSLGFLHKINGVVHAKLLVRTINMQPYHKNKLSEKPAFISAVDMT